MDYNDIIQMIRITKQYYELGRTQDEIAHYEHISKSTVSRILKRAEDRGYITIKINHPIESIQSLEDEFYRYFDIEKVFIAPSYVDNFQIRLTDTCRALAEQLPKMLEDNEIIGVSWGRMMEQLVSVLKPPARPLKNIRVVQLSGSVAKNVISNLSSFIVEHFSSTFDGTGYLLPAPVLVDTKEIADAIMSDSQIKMVLDLARQSNFAVFSIGAVNPQSVIVERGSFSQEHYKELRQLGAVGDIIARYFNIRGELVDHDINQRTIGLTLDELRQKRVRLALAVGADKIEGIVGALCGKICTHLYTDELTAKEVLKCYKNSIQA